jgi:CDP-diglyceride synthetase
MSREKVFKLCKQAGFIFSILLFSYLVLYIPTWAMLQGKWWSAIIVVVSAVILVLAVLGDLSIIKTAWRDI